MVSTSRTMSSGVHGKIRQASSGITSLLQTSQVSFRHRKTKTASGRSSGDRKSRQGRVKKKWHPGSLDAEKKLNGMCKANCTRSSGVEKNVQKSNPSNRNIRRKSRWKKAEQFRKYWRWPNNLQRNPLLYGSLRGGAIPPRDPANYSD